MRIVVLASLIAAVLVLLASLQAVPGLLRTLSVERRPRQLARRARRARRDFLLPPRLEQLEKVVGDALEGDRYALEQVARITALAGRNCGLDSVQLGVVSGAAASPAALSRALDALERDVGLRTLPRPATSSSEGGVSS